MDMEHVTLERAIEALEEAIASRGADYVYDEHDEYDSCMYVRDGRPSCLAGSALHVLGVSVERLMEADGDNGLSAGVLCGDLQEEGVMSFDDDARKVLRGAQYLQDRGLSWGLALEGAIKIVHRK